MDSAESLEQMQARHRKEAKELQGRITNKKKNATKKTRKGINDESAEMERSMKERQAEELAKLQGEGAGEAEEQEQETSPAEQEGGKRDEDGLKDKMDKLELEKPQTPTTQNEGGGGGGKKRNRQKERLARRAAEQEAAAAAAEQEASQMTDHRAIEKTYMLAEFQKHRLEEHEIRPDGHCLFSAVADQLAQLGVPVASGEQTQDQQQQQKDGAKAEGYQVVRRRAAEYILSHGDDYAGFLEEDLEAYAAKIRDTAEWGGQIELSALANVYGVEIHVVQDRDTEIIGPNNNGDGGGGGADTADPGDKKRIWLAYYRHGYGLGEHYNSLRKKD